MNNILEQIQSLTDKFNNLFEVEGLGDPASDVPPSTNKIKKDRKTKDGKVELVSVEDELFPYDGNKREQYRQKIIDTINNMIQGTATLEDLLQIVRQKKMPVKEGFEGAVEILEEVINEKLSPLQKREMVQSIKLLKDTDKWKNNKDNLIDFLRNDAKNTVQYGFKHRHDKDVDLKKRPPAHFEEKKEQKKAPLKEAVELTEEIINEVSLKKWKESAKNSYDKRKKVADKSAEADKKSWDNYEKQSKLSPEDEPELFKKAIDQGAIAYKDKKRADHAMGVYANTPDSKHSATKYNKAILNSLKGREDKYVETGKKSDLDRAINTFHLAKLNPVKEGFEGAIEILEDIINEVSVKRWRQSAINSLPQRAVDVYKAEGETEKAESRGDIDKAFLNQIQKEDRLEHAKEVSKTMSDSNKSANKVFQAAKKVASDRTRKYGEGFKKWKTSDTKEDAHKAYKEMGNLGARNRHAEKLANVEAPIVRGSRRTNGGANESFEGAIELAEDLYNYIKKKHGEPEYKGSTSEPANKSAELIHKSEEAKGKEYNQEKEKNLDVNLYNKRYQTKNTKGEKETEYRSSKYRKFSDDWRLPKTDDEKITASIRRNKLKPVKEAQELLEEIINEVSVGALARATENNAKKRQEAHRKSTESLKKAHDNYEEQSRKHPEDEPALYNALDKLSSATRKEGEKASHANDLANLNLPKDSKVSANKLFDKADKTYAKRGKEVDKALEKGKGRGDKEFDTPMKKYSRAVDLAVADPVVSRRTNGGANESFEGAIEILEEVINEVSSTTMRNALHAHNERKRELEDRANKRIGEIFKKNGIKGNTYGATTPDDIERAVRTEKEIQNDSEMKNIQKEQEKRARKNKLYVDALNKIHRAKLAEAQELSELFDRPDLLDDISKALTNKTIKQHLQDQAKKLLGGKKKIKKDIKENFDSLEENSYNIVKLLEEVINEISDKNVGNL